MPYRSIFRPDLFASQTIIVTGGGTGIGRMTAHELASLGAHVVLVGRRPEPLAATADEISAAGGSASSYSVNIRDENAVAAFFAALAADRPVVHGLVNNAGGQFMSPAADISAKGWRAVVDTNLNGTFFMCREAYQHYFAAHGGVIVNIVADMWRGFPSMAHTGAARAGVVNLTQTLAVEWAPAGVRVNGVAPGLIDGNGLQQYPPAVQAWIATVRGYIPAKRLGSESEVAAAITFLLSPAAAYISGATLRVDGAGSLWRQYYDVPDHDQAPPPFQGLV